MKKLIGFVVVYLISFSVFLIPHIDVVFGPSRVYQGGFKESSLKSNDNSCLSRYQSTLYRKGSLRKPSSYLSSRLRSYEALHKRCGPYTESYNRTIRKLESGDHNLTDDEPSSADCRYLVKIQVDGLGNRIISLASAFLYALLTNRVLLVYDNEESETADLFCEPFPEITWLLPLDFPIRNHLRSLNKKSVENYGNSPLQTSSSSPFVYHHLVTGYDENDQRFFCDQDQIFLQNASWVIMKSHFYFAPGFFFIKSFEKELDLLFPEKDTVFHFLGTYLFLPSNAIWDLVTRYYDAYLAKSDEKIGIQVRTFDPKLVASFLGVTFTPQAVPETVVACSTENALLPKLDTNESVTIIPKGNKKSIAVLLTSLTNRYFDKIRDAYFEHPTVNRDVIGVFQVSSEGIQKTGNKMHTRKAWAEIYLLSLTDKLITSPWSTFGYVAQGLGGLRPWILHMPNNKTVPIPACSRAISMEPCFHFPPSNDCKNKSRIDSGALLPHVRHCEDLKWGLKLFDPKA